jgi:hypothetical protein
VKVFHVLLKMVWPTKCSLLFGLAHAVADAVVVLEVIVVRVEEFAKSADR